MNKLWMGLGIAFCYFSMQKASCFDFDTKNCGSIFCKQQGDKGIVNKIFSSSALHNNAYTIFFEESGMKIKNSKNQVILDTFFKEALVIPAQHTRVENIHGSFNIKSNGSLAEEGSISYPPIAINWSKFGPEVRVGNSVDATFSLSWDFNYAPVIKTKDIQVSYKGFGPLFACATNKLFSVLKKIVGLTGSIFCDSNQITVTDCLGRSKIVKICSIEEGDICQLSWDRCGPQFKSKYCIITCENQEINVTTAEKINVLQDSIKEHQNISVFSLSPDQLIVSQGPANHSPPIKRIEHVIDGFTVVHAEKKSDDDFEIIKGS